MAKEREARCPVPHRYISQLKKYFLGVVFPERYKQLHEPASEAHTAIRELQNYWIKRSGEVETYVHKQLNELIDKAPQPQKPITPTFIGEFYSYRNVINIPELRAHAVQNVINVDHAVALLDVLNSEELWGKLCSDNYLSLRDRDKKNQFLTAFPMRDEYGNVIQHQDPIFQIYEIAGFIHRSNVHLFQGSITLFSLAILLGRDFSTILLLNAPNDTVPKIEKMSMYPAATELSKHFVAPVQSIEEYYQRLKHFFQPNTEKNTPSTEIYKLLLKTYRERMDHNAFQVRSVSSEGYVVHSCPAYLLTAHLFADFGSWITAEENKQKLLTGLKPESSYSSLT